MVLEQINPIDRIVFLKEFSAELVFNSGKSEFQKKQIEIEKLKQKFLQPIETPEKAFEKAINTEIFQKPVYSKEIEGTKPREISILSKRKQIFHRAKVPEKIPIPVRKQLIFQKQIFPTPPQTQQKQTYQPSYIPTQIQPEFQTRPELSVLEKLEPLLKDNSIQSIECPGPGKNILIKRYNKINVTRISLNQSEITNIINNFSQKARIPMVGGILKAAVGDLVISAIVSEFVGSRFIINKITPYSLIQG